MINKKEFQAQNNLRGLNKIRIKFLHRIARNILSPKIRLKLYKWMGISIGENVFIGTETFLDDEVPNLITIEKNVVIAFRVTIVAHDDTNGKVAPVLVKEGAYIGTGAIITMGTEIGKNAVVGAGAVVTKNVPENSTVVGVPAKIID